MSASKFGAVRRGIGIGVFAVGAAGVTPAGQPPGRRRYFGRSWDANR